MCFYLLGGFDLHVNRVRRSTRGLLWPSSVKAHFTRFIAGTPAYGELSQSSGGDAPMVRNALCGMDRSARDGTVRDSPWTRPWIVYEELV